VPRISFQPSYAEPRAERRETAAVFGQAMFLVAVALGFCAGWMRPLSYAVFGAVVISLLGPSSRSSTSSSRCSI
jgi:hypothetical protein